MVIGELPVDWEGIQEKWKRRWEEWKIWETDPDPTRKKRFLTVAYPYPNSPQHIGHGRTYTLTDVHARYLRMKGYNVLLPMAFHYTGTPILAMSKRLAAGEPELVETFIETYGVPKDLLPTFSKPIAIARYFHRELKMGMKEIGYSIDWRREFTTVDPAYRRFIEWQFAKLREKGLISQGSHPVGWCPSDGNPVGQHDTLGDKEPEIGEYTVIKFGYDSFRIPAATLRPETVFGVTNIWVRPEVEYLKVRLNGEEEWIVSEECERKLSYQGWKAERKGVVKGSDLVGRFARNPMTGRRIPILPATFVEPGNGTGIVMSVPAHAPYDLQAIEDLKKNGGWAQYSNQVKEALVPIQVVESEGYSATPARDIIAKMGIMDQTDPRLQEATTELYAHEFHLGRMIRETGAYAGLSVKEGRDRVRGDLIARRDGVVLFEIMNSPVVCRCGTECIVKIFENQWFINYGDPEWKELARECTRRMSLLPEDIRPEFEYSVEWVRAKACARKSGLGTPLPWDPEWIIESLSDSVIYMAYYTIAKQISEHGISAESLKDEVFDYVFLGVGDAGEVSQMCGIPRNVLEGMRGEFTYFYPVDSRHSGRDLVPNHLTFFIFNHAAIFPRELWPGQIVVNGSVLMEGKKMSKSYGNIIPLRDAVKKYGADPLRLAVTGAAELLADADISLDTVKTFSERLERFHSAAGELADAAPLDKVGSLGLADRWMLSKLERTIGTVSEAMDQLRVREAIHNIIYMMDQDLSWYLRRSVARSESQREEVRVVLKYLLETRIKMISPMAPFIAEEIWSKLGHTGSISGVEWPSPEVGRIDRYAEVVDDLIRTVYEDIQNILKVTGVVPKRIYIYASAEWKWRAYLEAIKTWDRGKVRIDSVIKALSGEEEFRRRAGEVAELLKKSADVFAGMSEEEKNEGLSFGRVDEVAHYAEAAEFLGREFRAEVQVFSEDDPNRVDPKGRARLARPNRPAIYIE